MYAVERLGCYITRGVYTVSVPFHSLGGAVDVIVVEQPDGSCKSSPWYVRLGKFQGALKPKEKVVYVSVNGVEADFNMYLDHKGEAYFLRNLDDDDDDDEESVRSSSSDETDGLPRDRRKFKSKSCNYDATSSGAEGEIEIPRGKSFGLFGRKSKKNNPNPDEKSGYGVGRADSLERAEIAANLLEVKWATDLATRKKDSRLMYSSFKNFKEKADKNMHNSDDKTLMSSSMEDNCDSHDDDKGNQNAWSGYNNSESVFRETSTSSTSLSSNDQSFEYSVSDDELLEEKCEMKYQIQMKIDEGTLETMQCSGSEKGIILETTHRDELIMPEQLSCIDINNKNVEAITRKSPSILEFIGDRVSPKVCNMSTPVNSDEKQLQFCVEFQRSEPTYLQGENFESYPSSESLDQENSTTVHMNSINESTFPIMVPKGHNVRNVKVTRIVKSLPNMRTRTDQTFLNDHLSHSLDSNPISTKLTRSEKSKTSFETKGDKEQHPVVESHASELLDDACGNLSEGIVSPSESRKIWPFSPRNSRSMKNLNLCQDLRKIDGENVTEEIMNVDQGSKILQKKSGKKKTRVMTPTSEQLESLNLKEGRNTVTFWFSTPSLGKKQVDARIFLWKWNTRIVISDVDGTITKSDVLGQFMPLVGIDWSQTGVTHLFSAIKENGYQILFLSARSISQAYRTRQFLINLKQDGKTLPEGPVIISPDGLLPSLYREVIRRAPHEFKIACLEKIRELFPADSNPFYAGFGNRDTDEMSYVKVGVPRGKIFIINPKGEVAVNHQVDTKSYTSYHTLVNDMFPLATSFEQEDYNSWNFWKLPLPVLES